ncbi:MAG: hypothetical protein AAF965_03995 [Pseudomonadota bacterium]
MITLHIKTGFAASTVVLMLSGCMSTEGAAPEPAPEPVVTETASAAAAAADTAASEPAMRVVTADELLATHNGICASYSGPSRGTECFNSDGTASYDDRTYGKASGSWRLNGNELCTNYPGDGESCDTIMTDGAGRYFDEDGYSWTIAG